MSQYIASFVLEIVKKKKEEEETWRHYKDIYKVLFCKGYFLRQHCFMLINYIVYIIVSVNTQSCNIGPKM
jgi:hypothetical protein